MIGEKLAGTYRIDQALGHSSGAPVYAGQDLRSGQPVAIALLPEAPLHHDGLAAVIEAAALPDGRPYLVLEPLEGVALDQDFVRALSGQEPAPGHWGYLSAALLIVGCVMVAVASVLLHFYGR